MLNSPDAIEPVRRHNSILIPRHAPRLAHYPTWRTNCEKGSLRLVERTRAGHVVDVLLPGEIHVGSPDGPVPSCLARRPRTASIEEADFLLTKTRREAIH